MCVCVCVDVCLKHEGGFEWKHSHNSGPLLNQHAYGSRHKFSASVLGSPFVLLSFPRTGRRRNSIRINIYFTYAHGYAMPSSLREAKFCVPIPMAANEDKRKAYGDSNLTGGAVIQPFHPEAVM